MFRIFILLFTIFFASIAFANESIEEETEDLIEACEKGNLKSAKYHLAKGAKVNARAHSGKTARHTTCRDSMRKAAPSTSRQKAASTARRAIVNRAR